MMRKGKKMKAGLRTVATAVKIEPQAAADAMPKIEVKEAEVEIPVVENGPVKATRRRGRKAAEATGEEAAPKPKKRSYANAYVRKGQGLSAIINTLADDKAKALEEAKRLQVTDAKALNAADLAQELDIPITSAIEAEATALLDEAQEKLKQRRGRKAKPAELKGDDAELEADETVKPKRKRKAKADSLNVPVPDLVGEAVQEVQETKAKKPRKSRAKKVVAQEDDTADGNATTVWEATTPVQKPKRGKKAKAEEVKVQHTPGTVESADVEDAEKAKKPKKPRRIGPDPDAFQIPTPEILEEIAKLQLEPRPVPNLGFACLNATLRAQKPPLYTNRGCIKKTWEAKGIPHVSQLVLENCRAIAGLVHWNHINGIRFMRMSSCLFPWMSEWDFDQLPDKEEIAQVLKFAGDLARACDQRLTFHPSHFVKLGCEEGPLLNRSLKELEQHSLIMDLMGYEPSPWNKINIHIGGIYGDKQATMERFAKNFQRLSPNCKKRLTVENDDQGNSYSLEDLLVLHGKTGIPLVFDFHHHRFCPGSFSEEEAFKKALETWPEGVRPVVHWSESQEGRKPHAHSDFVKGPLRLYGLDDKVDVMIESKAKELALLRLRDPSFNPSPNALALIYGPGDD